MIISNDKVSEKTTRPTPAPQWLIDACGKADPPAPKHRRPAVKVDPVAAEIRALHYLQENAPPAIEGGGGDHTAFTVAAMLKDFGIVENKALDLMLDHWNERCSPPWDPDELKIKVGNAYSYGQNRQGANSPQADFGSITESKNDARWDPQPTAPRFKLIHAAEVMEKLGPVNWQIEGLIETDSLGFIYGQSQSYKSFIALDMALCCASGELFHGREVKRGPVIYIAGEGHNGIARRVAAWGKHHKIDPATLPFYLSQHGAQFCDEKLAKDVARSVSVIAEDKGPPVMIFIDTLAQNMGGDENSNKDATAFTKHINDHIRSEFNSAIVVIHHTGHNNQDRARGASAFMGNIDFSFEMKRMHPLCTQLTCKKMKDAELSGSVTFQGEKIIIDLPGHVLSDSLVFSTVDYVPSIKLKPGEKKALQCLAELIRKEGKPLPADISQEYPPEAMAVPVEAWRDRYVESVKTKRTSALRSFNRYRDKLADSQCVAVRGEVAILLDDFPLDDE